ncbi:DUF5361 domain-containing protein [Nocardia vinacea]|uniref:DUF5361 domain-containing protein n=1 Tax=Nocardia vinacea TaxID=96468 RepID=UPI002E0DE776|nr:DUF5361 domain-containing protein [Nocardia vinacea]
MFRALHPEGWMWGLNEQLLAASVDTLNLLFWAKTEGARKGTGRPKPIPRPGITPPVDEIFGEPTSMSIDEMKRWLGWEAK